MRTSFNNDKLYTIIFKNEGFVQIDRSDKWNINGI